MLRSSPEWKVLLEPFESLFTKPGYRYFCDVYPENWSI